MKTALLTLAFLAAAGLAFLYAPLPVLTGPGGYPEATRRPGPSRRGPRPTSH